MPAESTEAWPAAGCLNCALLPWLAGAHVEFFTRFLDCRDQLSPTRQVSGSVSLLQRALGLQCSHAERATYPADCAHGPSLPPARLPAPCFCPYPCGQGHLAGRDSRARLATVASLTASLSASDAPRARGRPVWLAPLASPAAPAPPQELTGQPPSVTATVSSAMLACKRRGSSQVAISTSI